MDDKDQPILAQVLATLDELRKHVDLRLDSQDTELHEFHERFATMATKDDLKQFITRDLADARDTASTQRMNAAEERQQRIEHKVDTLRDEYYSRTIATSDAERATQMSVLHREQDNQRQGFQRVIDRNWMAFTLLASPLIYTLINYFITHPPK